MSEVFKGELRHLHLSSVLQLVGAEGMSGRLFVAEVAEIRIRDGRPVGATYGNLSGISAVEEMFMLEEGVVRLELGDPGEGAPLGQVAELVMAGVRLVDEWERLAPMVLAPAEPFDAGEIADVVALMDGERTVAEAVMEAGRRPSEVVDDILDAFDEAKLDEVAPPAPDRVADALNPPDPAEYYNLIDQGREHLRAGRLAEAEAAFRRARRARPDDRLAEQNLRRASQLRKARGE